MKDLAKAPETKQETEQFVKLMDNLIDHIGWKVVQARFSEIDKAESEQVLHETTADGRAIRVGRVQMVRMLRDWPVIQARASQDALEREAAFPGSVWPIEVELDK